MIETLLFITNQLQIFNGINKFNEKVLNSFLNFRPDLIVLGHADNLSKETILKIKKIKNVKICQWFLDPLTKFWSDYKKNKSRFLFLENFVDASFLTTHPSVLDKKVNNCHFIPNPLDSSFEYLNNSNKKQNKDLFFAMSHGVHRGVLKKGKSDEREIFLKD